MGLLVMESRRLELSQGPRALLADPSVIPARRVEFREDKFPAGIRFRGHEGIRSTRGVGGREWRKARERRLLFGGNLRNFFDHEPRRITHSIRSHVLPAVRQERGAAAGGLARALAQFRGRGRA